MFHIFRRKTKIINKEELISEMENIMELLNDNNFTAQANAFQEPIEYLRLDNVEKFLETFNSVDIWGGSGAAQEVGGFLSQKSERQFLVSFRKLIELMKNTGIKNRKAQSISNFFLKGIERLD